jgi:hypothetical protein
MAQLLKWHEAGAHQYKQGVDNMVLFPWDSVAKAYGEGVSWNGVVSIDHSPTGGDANPRYADNRKYLTLYSDEELGLAVNAFMYPPEFQQCDGTSSPADGMYASQQERKLFALAYRTKKGDEVAGELGYEYHFVYGCKASPSQQSFQSTGETPDIMQFSWTLTTTKVDVPNSKPSSHIVVDSTTVTAPKMAALLDVLYGEAATTDPVAAEVKSRIPLPTEIYSILNAA